ncbi:MAG: NAD(P)/FAD-dependent oxidoreductase, partial [Thermoanaerobaculia bacterium]
MADALRDRPYWLDAAPLPRTPVAPLPEAADVAIIGGGYTGVSAARILARHGADVALLERAALGWGASTRNGGFVLPGFKLDAGRLLEKFGPERGRRLFEASLAAVRFLEQLCAEEAIDCEYVRCGHVS